MADTIAIRNERIKLTAGAISNVGVAIIVTAAIVAAVSGRLRQRRLPA